MKKLLRFSLLGLLCLTFSCSQEAKEWDLQQELDAKGLFALNVELENGDIQINAISENKVTLNSHFILKGNKQELDQITEMIKMQLLPSKDSAVIKLISPSEKQFKYKLATHVSIGVPAKFDLKVDNQNGDLNVKGTAGQARLLSSNGNIVIKDLTGDVEAESTNGNIELTHVSGKKHEVKTNNGDVLLSQLTGVIQASTNNGDINGHLMGVNRPENYKFQTSNGTIELKLPADTSAKVKYRNSSGEIKTDFKHNQDSKEILIGDGTANITTRTSNGDINILSN